MSCNWSGRRRLLLLLLYGEWWGPLLRRREWRRAAALVSAPIENRSTSQRALQTLNTARTSDQTNPDDIVQSCDGHVTGDVDSLNAASSSAVIYSSATYSRRLDLIIGIYRRRRSYQPITHRPHYLGQLPRFSPAIYWPLIVDKRAVSDASGPSLCLTGVL